MKDGGLFTNFGYVPRGSPTAKVVAPMALFTLDEEHPLTKAGLRFVHVVEQVELGLMFPEERSPWLPTGESARPEGDRAPCIPYFDLCARKA